MIKFLDNKTIKFFLPFFIFLFALALRVYGINWDQNQHLHPDERFLTMTVDAMVWPNSIREYLSPSISKLNPYNVGAGFYVYGTLPTTIIKYFSRFVLFSSFQYNNITLTGRIISAIGDIGVVILVFLISRTLFNRNVGILASFLYSISVLPVQLSHFFAVDTFLNFFIILSFYFLIKLISGKKTFYSILLGISYGSALACKISALYFFPVILLGLIFHQVKQKNLNSVAYLPAVVLTKAGHLLLIVIFSYLSFRIFDPHVFTGNLFPPKISPQFIQNIEELRVFSTKESMFPPAIQWFKITPVIFPLKNIILWGLGFPLGILSVLAVLSNIVTLARNLLKHKNFRSFFNFYNHLTIQQPARPCLAGRQAAGGFSHFLILFWILFLFFYQGIQFTPSMRYFLPIYPFLAISTANFSASYIFRGFAKFKFFILLFIVYCLLLLVYPLSFLSIYSKPHSRVTASEWIYQNILLGSTLSCDAWDDCLPLNIEGIGYANQYNIIGMEPFAADTTEKQLKFQKQLNKLDYLVLTSNRAWGSLPKVPDKFPFMSKFYEDLFAGRLNFERVAEITSYPTIPLLNIPIPDQSSEEAFTVYDHPKVLIYKKISM